MDKARELQYIRVTSWYKGILEHIENDRRYRLERLADANLSIDEIRKMQGYISALRDLYNYITQGIEEE